MRTRGRVIAAMVALACDATACEFHAAAVADASVDANDGASVATLMPCAAGAFDLDGMTIGQDNIDGVMPVDDQLVGAIDGVRFLGCRGAGRERSVRPRDPQAVRNLCKPANTRASARLTAPLTQV